MYRESTILASVPKEQPQPVTKEMAIEHMRRGGKVTFDGSSEIWMDGDELCGRWISPEQVRRYGGAIARYPRDWLAAEVGFYTLLPIEPPKPAEPRYAKSGSEVAAWLRGGGVVRSPGYEWKLDGALVVRDHGARCWRAASSSISVDSGWGDECQLLPPEP
jgi:hypothetical protein